MRVDQGVNASVSGSIFHCLQQGIGVRCQSAIDHERAVFAAQGNDIAAGALKEREAAAEICR